jgi:hypothetical protein
MSLLAEELVEEWLNRDGYFTIRGIRIGNDEIDLLAIRPRQDGGHDCRHIEVQVSINPIAYVSRVPKALQKQQSSAKKRDHDLLMQGVEEWVAAKFDKPRKVEARGALCRGSWSKELVVGRIKHENEIEILEKQGVKIHRLRDILIEMRKSTPTITAASGADLFNLLSLVD